MLHFKHTFKLKYLLVRTYLLYKIYHKYSSFKTKINKLCKNCLKCYSVDMTVSSKREAHTHFKFHRNFNFRISDSMNDFVLTMFIEFSIKNYVFHIL